MRVVLAIRVFFRALFDRKFADGVRKLAADGGAPAASPASSSPASAAAPRSAEPSKPVKPGRSDALNLLAALQREGRLVDFLMEPIDGYGDAQVGAAVRDVHRHCAAVVQRMFALKPLTEQAEGSSLEVAEGFDAARIRLTGAVQGRGPFRGALCHHGWEATQVALPEWVGTSESQRVVAPMELEVRG